MKIVKLEDFHADGGWRTWDYLKITTDEGLVGWAEYAEGFGAGGVTVFLFIGGGSGSSNNSLTILGSTMSNGVTTVGFGGGGDNRLLVSNSIIAWLPTTATKGLNIFYEIIIRKSVRPDKYLANNSY